MDIRNLIDGQWETPQGDAGAEVFDASTAMSLGRQGISSGDQVERAIQAATRVAGSWAERLASERATMMRECAAALDARAADIAAIDARQTGVLLKTTQGLSRLCGASFQVVAELLEQPDEVPAWSGAHGAVLIERLPLGPAAIIAPWNAPSGIACHKLASALAAGCPVVFKPSEWAQGSAQVIAAALGEILPSGVFQLVHGAAETGAALVDDPRIAAVSFTGGLGGGRAVARSCAEQMKPAQLELGGSNPLVVLEDADLDRAADGVVTALTTLNGQWCRALGRLLVHETVLDELLSRVESRLVKLVIGPVDDPSSDMGPMVHAAHRDYLLERIDSLRAKGAEIRQPSHRAEGPGWFLAPTLIIGLAPDQTREELFGPVAFVHSFRDDAEAAALANDTPFGLAAYVFGSERRAGALASGIRAGIVKINGVTLLNLHHAAPRPAWGLSGLGDEGTRESFEFFRNTRVSGPAGPPPGTEPGTGAGT